MTNNVTSFSWSYVTDVEHKTILLQIGPRVTWLQRVVFGGDSGAIGFAFIIYSVVSITEHMSQRGGLGNRFARSKMTSIFDYY